MWSYDDKSPQNSPSIISATLSGNTKSIDSLEKPKFSWNRARRLLWEHFLQAYSNRTILIWSLFWAFAMGGFLQIQSYVQLLWLEIDVNKDNFYNGAVEATLTLFGAISCLIAGFISSEKFEKYDSLIMTGCLAVEGVMVIISSITDNVWVAYAMYVSFGVIYMFMITLASATVATNLLEDSFALIFGINTLVALVIQTLLTVIVISESVLGLTTRKQFLVFGGYFIVLALVFLIGSIIKFFVRRRK
jgi:solute carrier family 19 (thiamine transporter), member 2/3